MDKSIIFISSPPFTKVETKAYPLSESTLRACAIFFKKYPDLLVRTNRTGLSATHYQFLSSIKLPEEEILRFEEEASKMGMSVRELKFKIKEWGYTNSENELIEDFFGYSYPTRIL